MAAPKPSQSVNSFFLSLRFCLGLLWRRSPISPPDAESRLAYSAAQLRTTRCVAPCAVRCVFRWRLRYFALLEVQTQRSSTCPAFDESAFRFGICPESILPTAAFGFESFHDVSNRDVGVSVYVSLVENFDHLSLARRERVSLAANSNGAVVRRM
jgi:hypothetical protein